MSGFGRLGIWIAGGLIVLTLRGVLEARPRARAAALTQARVATAKYQDVGEALADGYVRDPLDACETPAHTGDLDGAGAMGIHYLRRDLLGIGVDQTRLDVTGTHTDFTRPAVLVYEPQADGSLELVAIENIVSAEAWARAGRSGPPEFQGIAFDYTPDTPATQVRANYDLHLWLFRENPDGVSAAFNPDASCRHHVFHMPGMIHP